jgi:hypothetical protein
MFFFEPTTTVFGTLLCCTMLTQGPGASYYVAMPQCTWQLKQYNFEFCCSLQAGISKQVGRNGLLDGNDDVIFEAAEGTMFETQL